MTKAMIVYTKPDCVQCRATFRHLDKAGVEYTAIDLTEDKDALAFVQALGHQAAPVVTTLIGSDLDHWSGYQPDRLNAYIQAGKEAA